MRLPRLKRIFSNLAETAVGSKLFSDGLECIRMQEEVVVKLDFDRAAGDAEVFELAAEGNDTRLVLLHNVMAGEPRHHAISRHDVKNIQTFDGRTDQSGVTPILLVLTSRNMR